MISTSMQGGRLQSKLGEPLKYSPVSRVRRRCAHMHANSKEDDALVQRTVQEVLQNPVSEKDRQIETRMRPSQPGAWT